ncbi:MAG TPA: hypothetical protein VFT95_09025 [Micromonosporaceae bacterium]|nr:hypothetical protein [Micromonosporaceae bacterium]
MTYILLTIGGLALLAAGLLADHRAPGLAWVTVAADVTFLAVYLWSSDLPPFLPPAPLFHDADDLAG